MRCVQCMVFIRKIAVMKIINKTMTNISTKANAKEQDADYESKREFIRANLKSGDIRDLAEMIGFTTTYLHMVFEAVDGRKSNVIIDTAYNYLLERNKLISMFSNNMSLTNP